MRAVTTAAVFFSIVTSVVGGCTAEHDLTVWAAETPSPTGDWLAQAHTVQNGGFGSAAIDTIVQIRRVGNAQPATVVLAFSCQGPVPHPYVLDNVANRGGTIALEMKWLSPTHLHVTYSGHPALNVQMTNYAGITITAEETPNRQGMLSNKRLERAGYG
jgi:hypothetical protein